jgi:hypothetical protein
MNSELSHHLQKFNWFFSEHCKVKNEYSFYIEYIDSFIESYEEPQKEFLYSQFLKIIQLILIEKNPALYSGEKYLILQKLESYILKILEKKIVVNNRFEINSDYYSENQIIYLFRILSINNVFVNSLKEIEEILPNIFLNLNSKTVHKVLYSKAKSPKPLFSIEWNNLFEK